MELRTYLAIFNPESEGGYTVTVPALRGLVTYGEDLAEAKEMLRDAAELYLESIMEGGQEVPEESRALPTAVAEGGLVVPFQIAVPTGKAARV